MLLIYCKPVQDGYMGWRGVRCQIKHGMLLALIKEDKREISFSQDAIQNVNFKH